MLSMRINFLGGPGSGKSTTAAWLFSVLKQRHVSVELVTEYVKAWACQKRVVNEFDQVYLLGKQMQYEYRFLSSGIKNIITDSPVMLSPVYADAYYPDINVAAPMLQIITEYEKRHPSLNIFLRRNDKPYVQEGRYQTLEQAKEIDEKIKKTLFYGESRLGWNVIHIDWDDRDRILETALANISPQIKS
jgi:nicotinamide riboside kinase